MAQLKGFSAEEEEKKGFLGMFKKASNNLQNMKIKYDKAETNVDKIAEQLEQHQVVLMKDVALLDQMYEKNLEYFKQLSMYILAGEKKLADERALPCRSSMQRPRHPDCRRTLRRPTTTPLSATALRKSSMI